MPCVSGVCHVGATLTAMIPCTPESSGSETTSAPARRRAAGKRSKTGCRTCRARHKKCDESPGACNNCTSTGRTCDGYDLHRLPREGRRKEQPLVKFTLPISLANGLQWVKNSDEQRAFFYFQHHTIPAFVGWFDSSLWQKLVLQMSHAEPAVYHAVVALSAIHQDSDKRGMPLSRENLGSTWHRFALEQAGRSFHLINARPASQDPRLWEVTLLCSLLYVISELLRGQYESAFNHLRGGICILKQLGAHKQLEPATSKTMVDQSLVEAFAHLDLQSPQFGVEGPLLCMDEQDHPQPRKEKFLVFRTLAEARQALDRLMNTVLRFTNGSWGSSHDEIASDYGIRYKSQLSLCMRVEEFAQAFNSFRNQASLTPKEQRGADLIYLHQRTATLALQICLLDGNEPVLDQYTPEFENILSLANKIMYTFPERPSVCLDMGIIPSLFLVATACLDYKVRWKAIEALRAWPHREGPWDSNLCAQMAVETMNLERTNNFNMYGEQTRFGDPEEPSLRRVFVTVAPDQRQARLSYVVGHAEHEQWFDLDVSL
ncbi:C6 zinc finger domain protein [Aspergillus sclerotioniger CBS 115572]|uniref:C6 zinc finger domain protein n=1 Tax=Aspergillus sclerotioniger CBS 115572 TaxID=1450535 RepID=A0A317WWP9_9EURO|nr:C6 zinc finger domain protein [Aspergillus sclerotioniger CBS 115572]PWY90321.1 C6 zinc finger domain protein [Aspergillus sclerotioniger CBS 115572]